MASAEDLEFSLVGLEEDLTCSICLSTFICPVTIPCGHNFCRDCLLATWKDSFSCPQCRTLFATKPELKKNTVLSTVVETFRIRTNKSESVVLVEESQPKEEEEKKKGVIRCDTCMEAEAAQTCLTCMASFCEEHLRPHRENPTFRLHQLSQPVADLMDWICPNHHKLMELFCTQHGRLICSLCLQQGHKDCSFTTSEEERSRKQSDLRDKLSFLDGKMSKNETVLCLMKDSEKRLKDSAINRKKAVSAEYQYIQDMFAREEQEALKSIDREAEIGQTKIRGLMAKFVENVDKMSKAKEEIHQLLSQSQTQAFLQASFYLPQAVNFDPYTPRINLDSKKVMQSEAFAASTKNFLLQLLKQPVENRTPILLRGERAASASGYMPTSPGNYPEPESKFPQAPPRFPRSHSPGPGPAAGQKKKPQKNTKNPPQYTENFGNKKFNKSLDNLLEFERKPQPRGRPAAAEPKEDPGGNQIHTFTLARPSSCFFIP
ncbi:E3 ubiquitin/ISG15 ligase TRIM25 [Nematolebias whitei]|uniref:E3 ubiquitin/ISG15 ligase TRIM25 n=1 Tax=Nematolebias whitei TaxID=451745 RepID=UPI00189B14D9|nr:E3 ubiquitin/ISG15 ligase TRIM25 [Nematolebias whitei]